MKFNKDTFLNDITDKVQSAIDKNLITKDDVDENNLERLHGFIQYALAELIEDRKFALDVLKDFNYDEKTPWDNLQKDYGTFTSLMDIALINLWKFLQSEGCTKYEYYKYDNRQNGNMLDVIRDDKDRDDGSPVHNHLDGMDSDMDNMDSDMDNMDDDFGGDMDNNDNFNIDDFKSRRGENETDEQPKRKRLRIVR